MRELAQFLRGAVAAYWALSECSGIVFHLDDVWVCLVISARYLIVLGLESPGTSLISLHDHHKLQQQYGCGCDDFARTYSLCEVRSLVSCQAYQPSTRVMFS